MELMPYLFAFNMIDVNRHFFQRETLQMTLSMRVGFKWIIDDDFFW